MPLYRVGTIHSYRQSVLEGRVLPLAAPKEFTHRRKARRPLSAQVATVEYEDRLASSVERLISPTTTRSGSAASRFGQPENFASTSSWRSARTTSSAVTTPIRM